MTRYFLLICFVLVAVLFSTATPAQAADTTFYVNHTEDLFDENPGDGICYSRKNTCTLRAAIQEANAFCGSDYCQETIILPAGTFKLTRAGTDDSAVYGDLDITGPVAIYGAGMGLTIIDGNASVLNDRIFHLRNINLGQYVSMQGLTLTNGKNKRGGAIYNQGMSFYFHDSEIRNSTSTYWGGGAIYNDDGTLTISGSLFSQNIAQGTFGFGGAIYNEDADLTINETMFMNNSGIGTGSGSWSYGGAIYSISGGVRVEQSLFFQNTTTDYGGAIYLSNGWLHLYKTTVQDNYAETAGGGIMVNTAATFKLEQSTVTGNMADINIGDAGGGLYLSADSAEISDSTISDNSAKIGGGIYQHGGDTLISHTTISDNAAVPDGGGVYHAFGTMILVQSTISDNRAARGGGLFNFNTGYASTDLILVNSTVSGNLANIDGGGIFNEVGDVELYSVTLANNQADGDGDTRGDGGGIFNQTGDVFLTNTILADNVHLDGTTETPDDCFGNVTSGRYNLIETGLACAILGDTTGNIHGADPELGPLQDNSGPTYTHAIPQTSKAVDAADPNGCLDHKGNLLEKDQRGFERYQDGDGDGTKRCDIGSFEYH